VLTSSEGKMSQGVQEELHALTTTLESEIFPSDIEKVRHVLPLVIFFSLEIRFLLF
jgi:hypothetical protein